MKRHSIIDYFALILWWSLPSDGIATLLIALILISASCQAPVLKITCWRCGALMIIAIVHLDISHWYYWCLWTDTLLCTSTSQGIQKGPAPKWLQSSFLEQRAEQKIATVSTLVQQAAITFSVFVATAWRCFLDSDRLYLWTHLISIIVSQWPYSLPNQVYWKHPLHVCQNWVKWRPF